MNGITSQDSHSRKNTAQIKVSLNVAVYGGSFNPVHEGHLALIRALCEDAEIDRVIVVPTRRSPFKPDGALLPDGVRWSMLRHALQGLPGVTLSDAELRRSPPSYTYETVHHFASLLPRARLLLAMGWDAFADFAQWQNAGAILEMAGLVVCDRAGRSPPPPNGFRCWAEKLPSPWSERAQPQGEGRLVTAQGRLLVRHLQLALPAISARGILRAQSLDGVPAGAREVLAEYWQQAHQA